MSRRIYIFVFILACSTSFAQVLKWGAPGTSLVQQQGAQTALDAVPTGIGKEALCWEDASGANAQVFVGFLDATGAMSRTQVDLNAADQKHPRVAPDWSDGAVVVWDDNRPSSGNNDIYAQHVGNSGQLLWNTGQPVLITNPSGVTDATDPMVWAGPTRSFYIVWITNTPNKDIKMTRVDASGNVMNPWGIGGVTIAAGPGDQQYVTGVIAADGGMILAWSDSRATPTSVYAVHVDSNGTLSSNNGARVSGQSNIGGKPVSCSDGAGGMILAWATGKTNADSNIVVQRLNGNGTPQWATDGVTLVSNNLAQVGPAIVTDNNGGAVVGWEDRRNGNSDIFVQAVDNAGTAKWTVDGVALCTATGNQSSVILASDQGGGAVAAWTDSRSGASKIFGRTIDVNGTIRWINNGFPLTQSGQLQQHAVMISQGLGGYANLAWEDNRNLATSGVDIYGQRVGFKPSALVTRSSVAFGSKRLHTPVTDTIRVRSTGTDSLVVNAFEFPGLTIDTVFWVASPVALPFKLGPGEDSIIVIQFNPSQNGNLSDVLKIHSNAANSDSVLSVALSGTGIYPKFKAIPDTIQFGGVRLNVTRTATMILHNFGTDTGHIVGHTITGSNSSYFTDTLTNYKPVAPGGTDTIIISTTPTKLGNILSQVQLITDDSTNPYILKLYVTGIYPKTQIAPAGLVFGKVKTGTSKTMSLKITNKGTDTLHIDSLRIFADTVRWHWSPATFAPIKPNAFVNLNVIFSPTGKQDYIDTLQLYTDDTLLHYNIVVKGTGSDAALTVTDAIDFGDVRPPEAPYDTIEFKYPGAGASESYTIQNCVLLGMDSAAFDLSSNTFPITVTGGSVGRVIVHYHPDSTHHDTTTLRYVYSYAGGTSDTGYIGVSGGPAGSGVFGPSALPAGVTLDALYPNPVLANGGELQRTTITVNSNRMIDVADLSLFNTAGQNIETLHRGALSSGSHGFVINTASLPAGTYLVRLSMREGSAVRLFTVVR